MLLELQLHSIWGLVRWVSGWKYAHASMREMNRKSRSPCYILMPQLDVVPPELQFHSRRALVWWVSDWKNSDRYMRRMRRVCESPCYVLIHHRDVALLDLQFYCCGDLTPLVPRWKEWRRGNARDEEGKIVTVFSFNASARCCVPSPPIRFKARFNVVSVWAETWRQRYE